ncbi:hypothetical protein ABIA65_005530 [Mycolicibacterium sp. 624]|jgi:hypothetical protein
MLALMALGAALGLMVIGFGLPYRDTWHSRWGNDHR